MVQPHIRGLAFECVAVPGLRPIPACRLAVDSLRKTTDEYRWTQINTGRQSRRQMGIDRIMAGQNNCRQPPKDRVPMILSCHDSVWRPHFSVPLICVHLCQSVVAVNGYSLESCPPPPKRFPSISLPMESPNPMQNHARPPPAS